MLTKTLRGGDIKIYINGQLFKPVTAFTFNLSSGHHSIGGIDCNSPFEIAPGPTRIKGNMEVLRARMDGGMEGQGVAASHNNILMEKYFTLAIVDRVTDSVVLYVEECIVIDQNWQIPSRGLVTGSVSFEGIGWANESDS